LCEGLDEILTLHRLGVFAPLGCSFKTTNCLENVNLQRRGGRALREGRLLEELESAPAMAGHRAAEH